MFLWEATEEKSSLREMESCVRQLKVEEEAALREAAPTIGIRALLIRGGDDGAGGYGGRRGTGREVMAGSGAMPRAAGCGAMPRDEGGAMIGVARTSSTTRWSVVTGAATASVVARRTSCEMEADGARRRMVAMRCRYVKMAVRSCHKKSRRDADDGGVIPSSSWKVGVKPTKVTVRCRLAKTAW